jgi:CPA1 family monovalent cation:H+ antiporter
MTWTKDGQAFPQRNLIVFVAFVVIRSLAYQQLVRELLQAQRRAIVQFRNQGTISNDVMHRIERDLDLEDSRLEI